mmetsp:Transcript_30997/g.77525  ORF Transcript_30997/g.77525 Transcript_30997/m.77525 type:complete len:201 (+) Transcript_30997:515-1117(+)
MASKRPPDERAPVFKTSGCVSKCRLSTGKRGPAASLPAPAAAACWPCCNIHRCKVGARSAQACIDRDSPGIESARRSSGGGSCNCPFAIGQTESLEALAMFRLPPEAKRVGKGGEISDCTRLSLSHAPSIPSIPTSAEPSSASLSPSLAPSSNDASLAGAAEAETAERAFCHRVEGPDGRTSWPTKEGDHPAPPKRIKTG